MFEPLMAHLHVPGPGARPPRACAGRPAAADVRHYPMLLIHWSRRVR